MEEMDYNFPQGIPVKVTDGTKVLEALVVWPMGIARRATNPDGTKRNAIQVFESKEKIFPIKIVKGQICLLYDSIYEAPPADKLSHAMYKPPLKDARMWD